MQFRLTVALILVTLMFLSVLYVLLIVHALNGAFGSKDKSVEIWLSSGPIIIGFIFVLHTLWSAKSKIYMLEAVARK